MVNLANSVNQTIRDLAAHAGEPNGNGPRNNLVSTGVGAVLGAVGALAANLKLSGLLVDNPFIGVAVFGLIAAVAIFVVALNVGVIGRGAALFVMGALIAVGVLALGAAAVLGPEGLDIVMRAQPHLDGVPDIDIAGKKPDHLSFAKDLTYHVDAQAPVVVDLGRLTDHYVKAQQAAQSHCVQELAQSCGSALGVGPTGH